MTLDEAIEMYTNNAEYERTHGSLQGCMDFRQLAEWLKELKQLREQTGWIPVDKIRDKIMKLQTYKMFEGEDTVYVECEDVLQIIDKYRESEDKDADKKCTYKETGCGSCKRQLDCPIEADTTESEG